MHVDSDVDRHCRPPFRARMSPGASLYRAEQERGPASRPAPIGSVLMTAASLTVIVPGIPNGGYRAPRQAPLSPSVTVSGGCRVPVGPCPSHAARSEISSPAGRGQLYPGPPCARPPAAMPPGSPAAISARTAATRALARSRPIRSWARRLSREMGRPVAARCSASSSRARASSLAGRTGGAAARVAAAAARPARVACGGRADGVDLAEHPGADLAPADQQRRADRVDQGGAVLAVADGARRCSGPG